MAGPTTIRELLVRIGVVSDDSDLLDLSVGLNQALELAKKLIGVLESVADQVDQVVARSERTRQIAESYGTTADQVQRLEYAFAAADGSAEALLNGLNNLAQVGDDVAHGGKKTGDAFALLGMRLDDVRGLKPDELLYAIADGAQATEDPIARATALSALLGERVAKELAPGLMQGAGGLRALGDEAQRAGYVLSKVETERLGAWDDAVDRSKGLLEALRTRGVLALLAPLEELRDEFEAWLNQNRTWIRMRVEDVGRRLGGAIRFAARAFRDLNDEVEKIGGWDEVISKASALMLAFGATQGVYGLAGALPELLARIAPLVPYLKGAGFWLQLIGDAFATGGVAGGMEALAAAATAAGETLTVAAVALWEFLAPILLATAIVAGLYLVIDDLITFMRGGDSVIGRFFAAYGKGNGVLDKFANLLRAVWRFLGAVWSVAKVVGVALGDAFGWAWNKAKPLRDFLSWLVGTFVDANLKAIGDSFDKWAAAFDLLTYGIEHFGEIADKVFGLATDSASAFVAWIKNAIASLLPDELAAALGFDRSAPGGGAIGAVAGVAGVRRGEVGRGGGRVVQNRTTYGASTTTIDARGMDRREVEGLYDRLQKRTTRAGLGRRAGRSY